MRQIGFLKVFLFSLLIFVEGCQLAKLNDPIIVTDVAEEFYIDLIEDLQSEPRELKFMLSTIQTEPCENYRIQLSTQRNTNRIILSINDIICNRPERMGFGIKIFKRYQGIIDQFFCKFF